METKRQLIHISMSGFALLLAVLSRPAALACAVAAFLFNIFVMPRIGKGTFREHEKGRGYSTGMLMYPISVFVLILIFPAHIAAGAWAIMAFGDGFASLIGAKFGKKKLPWNPNKSWAGLIGFVIAAAPAAWVFMLFVLGNKLFEEIQIDLPWQLMFFFFLALPATLAAAIVESLDIKLDDNLTVPLIAGIVLSLGMFFVFGCFITYQYEITFFSKCIKIIPEALIINLIIAVLSYKIKAIDLWGAVGGFIIGAIIYIFTNGSGFIILLLFFLMGTASTRIGLRRKENLGLAQERHGRRGLRHAIANCGAGLLFASVYIAWNARNPVKITYDSWGWQWGIAFTAAFAAATADTISSELGQLWGRRPVLITNFKPVPAGVNGGVTLTGTVLGLIAAAIVSAAACVIGLMTWKDIWIPIAAAQFGSLIDSLLGATLENRGLINNECVNFLCTLSAGLFAVLIAYRISDLLWFNAFFLWRYR